MRFSRRFISPAAGLVDEDREGRGEVNLGMVGSNFQIHFLPFLRVATRFSRIDSILSKWNL